MPDAEFVETVTVHSTARTVLRTLRVLIALTVVLYGVQTGQSFWIRANAETVRADAEVTRKALCTLRADLQERAGATQQYLDHNPTGRLSDAARTSVAGQLRTIQALRQLSCSPAKR